MAVSPTDVVGRPQNIATMEGRARAAWATPIGSPATTACASTSSPSPPYRRRRQLALDFALPDDSPASSPISSPRPRRIAWAKLLARVYAAVLVRRHLRRLAGVEPPFRRSELTAEDYERKPQ